MLSMTRSGIERAASGLVLADLEIGVLKKGTGDGTDPWCAILTAGGANINTEILNSSRPLSIMMVKNCGCFFIVAPYAINRKGNHRVVPSG